MVDRYIHDGFCGISPVIASVFSVMCELWSSAEKEDRGGDAKEKYEEVTSRVRILFFTSLHSQCLCVCVF